MYVLQLIQPMFLIRVISDHTQPLTQSRKPLILNPSAKNSIHFRQTTISELFPTHKTVALNTTTRLR